MGKETSPVMKTNFHQVGNPKVNIRPVRGGSQENPEQIEHDIEQTRTDMGETIDAIEEKLSPQRLKEEAKEVVREQTVGRAENAMYSAEQTAKETGQTVTQTIKQHPIPAAMVGIGLGWLVMSGRGSSSSVRNIDHIRTGSSGSSARHTADQYAGQAQGMAQQYAGQAQQMGQKATQKAKQAKGQFQQMLHKNPLGMAAVALGAGAAVGLMVPESQKENQMMGDARDSLMETAQHKAEETMHKAEHVVSEAKDTAQQEAQQQGLSPS